MPRQELGVHSEVQKMGEWRGTTFVWDPVTAVARATGNDRERTNRWGVRVSRHGGGADGSGFDGAEAACTGGTSSRTIPECPLGWVTTVTHGYHRGQSTRCTGHTLRLLLSF